MDHWTDKSNPEFERWWATKKAVGYQYGREALENVRFGFEGAQEMRWQPIETAPRNIVTNGFSSDYGPRIWVWPINELVGGARWFQSRSSDGSDGWSSDWQTKCNPTHWIPLPAPPKE